MTRLLTFYLIACLSLTLACSSKPPALTEDAIKQTLERAMNEDAELSKGIMPGTGKVESIGPIFVDGNKANASMNISYGFNYPSDPSSHGRPMKANNLKLSFSLSQDNKWYLTSITDLSGNTTNHTIEIK